jgi:tetratricopeptide (TPR) repeat protein
MHVKYVLLAMAASGAAFYSVGRYGHDVDLAPPAAIRQAMALGDTQQTQALPQIAQAPTNPPAQAPAQPTQKPPAIDESALRYFASQGDRRRMEAELARLRALYPEWQPPADLTSPGSVGDPELERMWKLFSEGKIGEVRAAIAKRGTSDPNWRAPADLVAQLDAAEAGQRLVNASDARQWEQVIRIGTETPALLTCANVDALWRVAEAFVQTGKQERARDAYAYVLTNCNTPGERVGTMQKALATLPEAMVEALLAQERESEFSSIRDELARRRIGRAAEDAKLTVSADDLRRIETLANAAATPDDAILLGFYSLHQNMSAKAETWFRTALSRNGGAKAAEGAVLAFGLNKKYAEAEALGAQWLEAGAANRKAYLDVAASLLTQEPPPKLERAVVDRIAKAVGTDRYAPGAASLGWYAYNCGQTAPAERWFDTALSWDRSYEPAAYGLALSRQRMRDRAGLQQVMTEWGKRSERIAALLDPRRARLTREDDLPRPDPVERAATRPAIRERAESVEPAPARTVRTETVRQSARIEGEQQPVEQRSATTRPGGGCGSGTTGAAALQRGWCLLNLKRPAAAVEAFEAAMRSGNAKVTADAAAGKSYAKMQQGLTSEASVAAAQANVSPARRAELSAVLLGERFYAQYDARDFTGALVTLSERSRHAPETTDLMLMRGWSYFNLGRYDDASKVFTAIYRANGSAQAMSGLTAIRDITQRNRY